MDDGTGEKSLFEDIFRSTENPGTQGRNTAPPDLKSIDRSARILNRALDIAYSMIEPGIETGAIAEELVSFLDSAGADPGHVIGISPENVAWHGLPGNTPLEEGSILTVDIACSVRGWWADTARSFAVGSIDRKREKLLKTALDAVNTVLERVEDSFDGSGIAARLEKLCLRRGFSLVEEAAGHGIGRRLHEEPTLTYDGRLHMPMEAGRVYTVEPIVSAGDGRVGFSANGEGVTTDGEPTAHFEVTVLALTGGYQVLGSPEWLHSKPC